MSISISSRKAKARNLQKWVCAKISDLIGIPWGKDKLISSREMGQAGVDVRLVGKAKRIFPWDVECKWQESWNIPGFIRDAAENSQGEIRNWLLIVRRKNMRPVAILDAEAFFEVLASVESEVKGSKIGYSSEWRKWCKKGMKKKP